MCPAVARAASRGAIWKHLRRSPPPWCALQFKKAGGVCLAHSQPKKKVEKFREAATVVDQPLDDPEAEKERQQRCDCNAFLGQAEGWWLVKGGQAQGLGTVFVVICTARSPCQNEDPLQFAPPAPRGPRPPAPSGWMEASRGSRPCPPPPHPRLIEQADFQAARELFGASEEHPLDGVLPKSLKEFENFAFLIVQHTVTPHRDSKHFKSFVKALVKEVSAPLNHIF